MVASAKDAIVDPSVFNVEMSWHVGGHKGQHFLMSPELLPSHLQNKIDSRAFYQVLGSVKTLVLGAAQVGILGERSGGIAQTLTCYGSFAYPCF